MGRTGWGGLTHLCLEEGVHIVLLEIELLVQFGHFKR